MIDDKLEENLQDNDGTCQTEQSKTISESEILTDTQAVRKAAREKKLFNVLLIALAVLLIASVVLRFFIGCRINVSGDSMEPNFHSKSTVWVDKTATPKRGDVVVLYENELTVFQKVLAEFDFGQQSKEDGIYKKLIKRVVALGGDKIWTEPSDGGYVLVIQTADGQTLREDNYRVGDQTALFFNASNEYSSVPWINKDHLYNLNGCNSQDTAYIVPEGCFYFLGDNRNNSNDSRNLGALPLSCIYGVVS